MLCQVKKLHENAKAPCYMTAGAAAADVCTPERVVIKAGEIVKIPLGIGFMIPKGYCVKMYPRSSLMIKKGLIQPVSIIDSDFSGCEIHCPLYNCTKEDCVLEAGERVAQVQLQKVNYVASWEHKDEKRDSKGFGGTGRV